MAAAPQNRPLTPAASRAMRVASAVYARAVSRVAGLLPVDGSSQAVDVFDALQQQAYRDRGIAGLWACWRAEAAALIQLRFTMMATSTDHQPRSPFSGFVHDVRDAWRAIRRSPGTPMVMVLTLAIGIGVNTAVFTVVDALLFKRLPYADAEHLVRVAEWPRTGGNFTAAPVAFLAWKARAHSFAQMEAETSASFALLDGGDAKELAGSMVTPGYFDLLGLRPEYGRGFDAQDAVPGSPCRVIVSHRLWAQRLGATPAALGRAVHFSGQTCTLIGVLPRDSVFERSVRDVYTALAFDAKAAADDGRFLTVLARLSPGVSIDAARSEMTALASSVNAPRGRRAEGWTVALTPWRDVVTRSSTRALAWTLFAAVAIVLLVAAVNVASLSLARSVQRRRELAVRAALGAGRWRMLRGVVVENLMLAVTGEALALLVGSVTLRVLLALVPAGTIPPENAASLDGRALIFASAASLVVALVCGAWPAWRGSRVDLSEAIRSSSRGATGSRALSRLHSSLLVAEIAFAMVLLVGASLLTVSFNRLLRVDPGFSAENVLTMSIALPPARYATDEAATAFFERLIGDLRRLPGVQNTAAVTSLPLGGWLYGTSFTVQELANDGAPRPGAHIQSASDGYFPTLGIPLVAGRDFSPRDDARSPLVAIVNETFVRRFMKGGPAVGRHLVMDHSADGRISPAAFEIVGVIHSVKTGGLADADLATPEIYVPLPQQPIGTLFVAARSASNDASHLTPDIRAAIRKIDPELPATDVLMMADRIGDSVRMQRFRTGLIGAFGLLAAALACVGVYGVRSRAVAARRRDMGIRLAMGASRADIVGLIVGESARLVATGLAIGLIAALALAPLFSAWLYATRVVDPLAIAGAGVLLGAAGLAAGVAPARRAANVDPLTILRDE